MPDELVISHGIEFIKSGTCHQCGNCDCDYQCLHHFEEGGKHWCAIYDQREEFCEDCGTYHAGCVGFPDNPWIHVVRDGICGFTFRRADGGSMDDLPFLDGEPWLRA